MSVQLLLDVKATRYHVRYLNLKEDGIWHIVVLTSGKKKKGSWVKPPESYLHEFRSAYGKDSI